jgi:hypothetical protein
MAEYQTQAQLKELGDVVIERDSTFGSPQEKERLGRQKKDAEEVRRREPILAQGTFAMPKDSKAPEAPIEPEILSVGSHQPCTRIMLSSVVA